MPSKLYCALLFLVCGLIAFFHVWHLAEMPRGLYLDESSIGYNAILIAATGHDEHGDFLPVYFKAFGEYKNPLYIYTAAIFLKLFGISEFSLRFTSVFFFALFLGGVHLLTKALFGNNRPLTLYALVSASFLPWFFTVSRIAFEVVSQLTTTVFALYFVYRAFNSRTSPRAARYFAALAGLCIGASLYSYSTGRLLAFLFLAATFLVYTRRHTIIPSLVMGGTFAATLLPYLFFSLAHPGALTARFAAISYVSNSTYTLGEKAWLFITSYITHFDLGFLLLRGDSNLRHATGFGGQLLLAVFLLAIVGVLALVWQRREGDSGTRFGIFLLLNLLLAPTAAALTNESVPHALRSLLVGLYFLLLSLYGFYFLVHHLITPARPVIIGAVWLLLLWQSGAYLAHYFTTYVPVSITWFESYNFKQALSDALARQPAGIVVSTAGNQPYIQLAMYRYLVPNPLRIPLSMGLPRQLPGHCILEIGGPQHGERPYELTSLHCYVP